MSQITENTMIIKKADENAVQKDYEKYKDTYYRISNMKKVYSDEEISIYVFDANGESPWEIEKDTVIPIALETNYLNGDKPWTRINGCDYEWSLSHWLKGKLPKDKYEEVCNRISYSI